MQPRTKLEAISLHYVQSLPGDEMEETREAVRRTVDLIVDNMLDQDMPEQEIISILLPLTHPLNGPEGRS
jgi:hypothetical protein